MRWRPRWVWAAAALVSTVLAGCSSSPAEGGGGASLEVFAAASLTEAFTALGESFENRYKTPVAFTFAASSSLARQVADGAPADVVATADETTMALLTRAGQVQNASVFARSPVVIVVERGNPERVQGPADLGRDGLVVVACAAEVPCGRYADELFAAAGVRPSLASREDNVKGVVAKVAMGEADAGVVYGPDALAASDTTDSIPVLAGDGGPLVEASYSIALVAASSRRASARRWVRFVSSPVGRALLSKSGFTP